ncbi:A24 family peptidase [Burkholderia metallica]|uniref:A24 family peptidase n=1 Tax=Burkholderia metallica TaxID=488729 RepID=UPI001575620C|nr:prepilin peptidase [Burkholderia metallica]NTZ05894.1 prepilin peptidase [Burkholderia metallica]
MGHLIFSGVFLTWAGLVTVSDIRFRRISNALVVAGVIAGFGGACVASNPFGISVHQAVVGMLVGLIGLMPFFLLRVMGAADVKIFAVLGVWCGAHALLWLWVVASLAAGLHALALMLLTRSSFGGLRGQREPVLILGRYRATPYAACLAVPAAAWLVYLVAIEGVR